MALPYPSGLASGVVAEEFPLPIDLIAGSSFPISTNRAVVAADVTALQVVAEDETGKLVPWNPATGAATGTLTFSGAGTADDTITINGHVITLKASGATGAQINIGGSATATAAALVAYINANPDAVNVRASNAAGVVTLTALEPGVGGNAITTTESGSSTSFGAVTLTGGSAETENKAVGIACNTAVAGKSVAYWNGGDFNHAVLGWPAAIDTLEKRRKVFAGTPIAISRVL